MIIPLTPDNIADIYSDSVFSENEVWHIDGITLNDVMIVKRKIYETYRWNGRFYSLVGKLENFWGLSNRFVLVIDNEKLRVVHIDEVEE